MSKLLFHRVGSAETSPFDEAIVSIAKGNHIKLVSPYIGLRYLQRLVSLSLSWRLISDIEAWLSSLANQDRILSTQFIQDNRERIHHFPAIHAKTVIGRATAYLGSANLTSAGIQTRTEMGVLVDEPAMIADLNLWFDALWQATSMPVMSEVLAYSRGLDSESREQTPKITLKSLSFNGEQVRANLLRLSDTTSSILKSNVISKSPSIERNLFRDLEDEVRMLIEKLANSGFTFNELLTYIRSRHISFRTCAVYLELTRYCGNLPRSVFSPDTINRLIYKNGFFRQSNAPDVATSLAQYDTFLAMLIECLSFENPMSIPGHLEVHSSIRRVWLSRWLYDLTQSGLLIEFVEITKDSLGSYQLNEKFEWTGRWRLFDKARQVWNIKLKYSRGLVILPNAMNDDDKHSKTEINILKNPDKSIVPIEINLILSRSLGASVYTRTHVEKRLPPNMATTVSSSFKLPPVLAKTIIPKFKPSSIMAKTDRFNLKLPSIVATFTTITNSHKKILKQRKMLSINNLDSYRADNVYYALFERLAKSENPGVIEQSYFQLINHLAKDTGESTDFVFQVLRGGIESLSAAAKIIISKSSCSVSALLNEIPAYPRTSDFLSKSLGKGKIKFNQSLNDENRNKVESQKHSKLSLKLHLSNESDHKPIADETPEGNRKDYSEMRRVDEMADYMQRVASIFKNPSA